MIKRIFLLLFGAGLIASVVWLGLKTRDDPSLVIWFGLASAILTPLGFAAIGYALSASNRQVLERLSRVPQIADLIAAAKTQEEKIHLLEQERSRLLEVVQYEARKQSLDTRKGSLERDAVRILGELEAIDAELSDLKIDSTPVTEEIQRLQARLHARQKGDLVFRIGSYDFILEREMFLSIPFVGGVVFNYFESLVIMNKKLQEFTDRLFSRN